MKVFAAAVSGAIGHPLIDSSFVQAPEVTGVMRSAEGADRLQTGPPKRRCVCFWHIADIDADDEHVRFWG